MRCHPLKKVLVTGGSGQLGQALKALDVSAQMLGLQLEFASHSELDIGNAASIARYLERHPASALINAAAYTHVDRAETNTGQAWRINAEGPGLLAQACKERHIALLHLSTDYVFNGAGAAPWIETDVPDPLNAYGRSKLAGERSVLASLPDALIIRTSWVFSQYGDNFLKTVLRLASAGKPWHMVNDQHGGPTYAGHLAWLLLRLIKELHGAHRVPGGIYHFAGQPYVSRYEFARTILSLASPAEQARAHEPLPVASDHFSGTARRPMNSRLSNDRLEALLGPVPNQWSDGLRRSLDAIGTA